MYRSAPPECPLPEAINAAQFAETVHTFRQNEISWNRSAMAVLTKADKLVKVGRVVEAEKALNAFASSCPWPRFNEVALDQAKRYR